MFYSGGFLIDSGKNLILLHKRNGNTQNNPNLWAFFGGMSENDEKPMDTFIREIKEELGIDLQKGKIHALRDYFNTDFNTHRNVFYTEFDSKEPLALGEGEDFRWVSLEDAFKLDLSKRTLEDLIFFKNLSRDKI